MTAMKTTQDIIDFGVAIFQSEEVFFEWVNKESLAMGNRKPVDLLTTTQGQATVLGELDKLNHSSFKL
jgi:uncharacterized protein (DUF2384 family)